MNRVNDYNNLYKALRAYGEEPSNFRLEKTYSHPWGLLPFKHVTPHRTAMVGRETVFSIVDPKFFVVYLRFASYKSLSTRMLVDCFRFCACCKQPFSLLAFRLSVVTQLATEIQRNHRIMYGARVPDVHEYLSHFCGDCASIESIRLTRGPQEPFVFVCPIDEQMVSQQMPRGAMLNHLHFLVREEIGRSVAENAARRILVGMLKDRSTSALTLEQFRSFAESALF